MTIRQIISDILLSVRNYRVTASEQISDRYVAYLMDLYRSILVKRDLDKKKRLDPAYIQTLSCVSLIQASRSECEDCDPGCVIMRTEQKIPKPIELNTDIGLTFVGTVTDEPFDFSSKSYSKWSKYRRWTGKKPRVYMKGDYIYVEINDSRLGLLEKIKVEGVFQSPTEVDELNKCDKCGSHSIDDEYKLPSHQVPVLKQMILEDLLRGVQLPSDKVNNSSNDIGSGVKAE